MTLDIHRLLRQLSDSDAATRLAAARALGPTNDTRAVPSLCQMLLHETRPPLRHAAMAALRQIDEHATVVQLCTAVLHDGTMPVREAAMAAVEQIGGAMAVEALCEALRHADMLVRWHAESALRRLGTADALPRLVVAEARLPPRSRMAALEALGAAWSRPDLQRAEAYCRALTCDADPAVREGARAILSCTDLVRSAERPPGGTDLDDLLRPAHGPGDAAQDHLLRPSGAPREKSPED